MNKIKNISLMLGALAVTTNSVSVPTNVLAKENELFTKKITKNTSDKYLINWTKSIGGDKEDKFYNIIQAKDGGLITVGQASLSPTTGFTTGDAIIVKYNANGDEVWRDVLSGDETDRYYSAIELEDGSIIAFGISYSTDLGFTNTSRAGNAIISKYGNDGAKKWTKNFKDGSKPIVFKNAVSLSDGSILAVCGKIEANIGGDAIEKDNISTHSLVKLSNDGSVEWEKKYTDPDKEVVITDIKNSSDGNILLTGYTYETAKKSDTSFLVAQIDENGTEIWSNEEDLPGTSIANSIANSIAEGLNGEIYVAGEFAKDTNAGNTDAILISLNMADGEPRWSSMIDGEEFDSFESVSVNSKGEVIVIGHSNSKLEGTTITDKKEVIVAKFGADSQISDIANLGPDTQGLVVNSMLIDENDKLVIVGKKGMDPGGDPCDLVNPCVQFDAILLSVTEQLDPPVNCTTNKPVLSGKDITITVGDKINPKDYVELKDPTLQHLVNLITFTTDLKVDGDKYFADKAGEYFIKYEVSNDCGVKGQLQLKVTVKEPSCEIDPPKINGEDKATYYIGDKFYVFDLVKVTGLDTKKVIDTKVEAIDGKSVSTITYESGDRLVATSNIDFDKKGTYSAEFKAINKCGEASKTVSISVKEKGDESNSNTEKPQTGDNTFIYLGLATASVVGLVLVNKNNKKDEDSSNEENK